MKINRHTILFIITLIILSQIPIIFTNLPFLTQRIGGDDNAIPTFVHSGHVDYFTYLSFIRESKEGAWSIPALYTTEPAESSSVYYLYIAIGKFASVFNLTPTAAYHFARLLMVELFALGLVVFIAFFTSRKAAVYALAVSIFATTPLMLFGHELWDYSESWRWWYNMDTLFRFDNAPHHHAGTASILFSVLCYFSYRRTKDYRRIILASLFAFLGSVIFPTPGLIAAIGIPFSEIILYFRRRSGVQHIVASLIVLMSVAIGYGLIFSEIQKGFPWSQWTQWDILHWNQFPHFDRDFLIAGNILLLLALPGILGGIFRSRNIEQVFLALWIILPYILLPFSTVLAMAKIRFVFLANYIPLSILTVQLVVSLVRRIHTHIGRRVVYGVLLAVYIMYSLQTTYRYYTDKVGFYSYRRIHTHITPAIRQLFTYLQDPSFRYATILAGQELSIMLPAYAPVRSYWGHPVHTYDYDRKAELVYRFYSGRLSSADGYDFLKSNNIDYVIAGPEELGNGFSSDAYPYLREIFRGESMTLFRLEATIFH